MKKRFKDKQRHSLERLKVRTAATPAAINIDNAILDLVMKCLYEHPDKDVMNLEEEIYKPLNIVLPRKVSERVWESLKNSGMISPLIGFGNAGKVELTNTGMQIMSRYGSYNNYLQVQANAAGPAGMPYMIQVAHPDAAQQNPEEDQEKNA